MLVFVFWFFLVGFVLRVMVVLYDCVGIVCFWLSEVGFGELSDILSLGLGSE